MDLAQDYVDLDILNFLRLLLWIIMIGSRLYVSIFFLMFMTFLYICATSQDSLKCPFENKRKEYTRVEKPARLLVF